MPAPSTSLATLRPDLGGSLLQYDLDAARNGFIAQRVAPVFEAGKQAGTYGKIPLKELLQNRETKRAPGSGYARNKFTFTTDNYACEEHGAEDPVDDRAAEMYREYFDAELVSAMRARDVVLRNAERRMADLIFNATTWTGASLTTAITNEWDDAANAVPITDVEAAARKVWLNSGMWPNALVINRHVFRNLRLCQQIIDRIAAAGAGSPTKPADITAAMIAACFDLEEVIIAGEGRNTANEGQAASLANIWSDEYAMLCRVARRVEDISEPCIARTFHWGEDGSSIGGTLESYREEGVRGQIIRVRHDVDEKVIYTEMGHLLSNVTTI